MIIKFIQLFYVFIRNLSMRQQLYGVRVAGDVDPYDFG